MKATNWWGKGGIAHHVSSLSTMRSACGRDLAFRGQDLTRLDPETGEPWPRCQRCEKIMSSKVGADHPEVKS